MAKKYELTDETIDHDGRTLYRIRALKDFRHVESGDIGGFIEKEENLFHGGNAWVFEDAKVYGNARVYGDAWVYGNARVCGDAWVYGIARVNGDAWVYGNVWVYGNARVYGDAWVYGNARVYGDARVCGDAKVYEYAGVFGNAWVYGNARVCGNARVGEEACIIDNASVISDFKENLKESIRCQTGLGVFNDKVIAYKQVTKSMRSFYDPLFAYKVGAVAEAKDPEISDKGCAPGLHFSNMNYWNASEDPRNSIFIMAEIDLEDVITVQQGKIRCRKAKILGAYEAGE